MFEFILMATLISPSGNVQEFKYPFRTETACNVAQRKKSEAYRHLGLQYFTTCAAYDLPDDEEAYDDDGN